MSVQAISYVLENSRAEHSARLVVISLANHAGGDGGDSYPSIGTIARETRLGESTIRAALEQLKAAGEIVETGLGPKRTRRFRLVMVDPAESAAPQNLRPRRIEQPTPQNLAPDPADSAPEPTTEPTTEPSSSSSPVGAEPVREDVARLCRLHADLIRGNDPRAKVAPESKGWTDPCRLLIDRDGREPELVERVIRFCAADDFERCNVLSMRKLRERFTQLAMKANRARKANGSAAAGNFAKYDQAAGLRNIA